MNDSQRNEIIRSFRNGAPIGTICELNPTVDKEEIREVLKQAGFLGEDGRHIGCTIKAIRKELGITQRQLGVISKADRTSINKIENEKMGGALAKEILRCLEDMKENGVPEIPEPEKKKPEPKDEPGRGCRKLRTIKMSEAEKLEKPAVRKCTKISTKKVESESREDPVKSVQESRYNDILSQESVQESPESVQESQKSVQGGEIKRMILPQAVFDSIRNKVEGLEEERGLHVNAIQQINDEIKEIVDWLRDTGLALYS